MGANAGSHPRRLAPAFRAPETAVVILDGTVQQLTGPDYNRISLLLCPNGAGDLFITLRSAPVAGTGLVINMANGPFILTYTQHGRLVQEAWYANQGMLGVPVTVITLSLQDEDYIRRI